MPSQYFNFKLCDRNDTWAPYTQRIHELIERARNNYAAKALNQKSQYFQMTKNRFITFWQWFRDKQCQNKNFSISVTLGYSLSLSVLRIKKVNVCESSIEIIVYSRKSLLQTNFIFVHSLKGVLLYIIKNIDFLLFHILYRIIWLCYYGDSYPFFCTYFYTS